MRGTRVADTEAFARMMSQPTVYANLLPVPGLVPIIGKHT